MADVLPKIRVTDPQSKDSVGLERQDTTKLTSPLGKGERPLSSSGKSSAKPRGSPITSPSPTNGQPVQNGGPDGRRQSEAAIDPLSQQILKRTNTAQNLPQKQRQSNDNGPTASPTSPSEALFDAKSPVETTREANSGTTKDKKKGVSFLSRIIGNKRKGTLEDNGEDESEAGDPRPEGMDAQLFSQPIGTGNMGFSPRHPQPPAYIKVRTRYKKEKEFNHLFLAQELRSRTIPPEKKDKEGTQTSSGTAGIKDPVWATEFSKDGKFLAAGGQDKVVRVWAVIATPEDRRAHEREEAEEEGPLHLSAPVFQKSVFREYSGHTATILDLSWSKNNFLLSSSMDKTVRLWHISRNECLCTFKHTDFVPSIQFHPKDDRFFLAGSLDTKLRLWSIPDKSVAFWNQLPDMITAVSFTPDGKTCIAGTLNGLCMFYETEGLKYQTQIHVKSTRGKNTKGSKITGIQTAHLSTSKEVKLLISSNDSRVRLYNLRDKSLEIKFKGLENNCSQIRASFADDAGYVICGSEDRKAYIWSTSPAEGDKRNQRPMDLFDAHNSITTCAIIAPLKTRQLLSNSEDPIYDLCNPPPVTLVSTAESVYSSRAPTDTGSAQGTPTPAESTFKRVEESPAYIARSAHNDGNIIVTADYTGCIKVFRQDCAFQKRMRASQSEIWETSSVFSKRKSGRPSSVLTRASGRTRRDSTSTQPPADRILSWRQDISHGSFDSVNGTPRAKPGRSVSPRKSLGQVSMASSAPRHDSSPALRPISTNDTLPSTRTTSRKTSLSEERHRSDVGLPDPLSRNGSSSSNPLWVQGGQSWAFWNTSMWKDRNARSNRSLAPPDMEALQKSKSVVSALTSSEDSFEEEEGGGEEDVKCRKCGATSFKARPVKAGAGSREERKLVCTSCGTPA